MAWVDGLTLGQVLQRTAERFAAREAVVFPKLGYRRTWAEFSGDVESTARGLLALGITKGDHVAIWATNVPEWILLQFATARIGAVLVTINPAYRAFELDYVLRQSDTVALFLVPRFKSSDYFAMLGDVCPELATCTPGRVASAKCPRLRAVVAMSGTA